MDTSKAGSPRSVSTLKNTSSWRSNQRVWSVQTDAFAFYLIHLLLSFSAALLSTETIATIRGGEPWTATSTFTQLNNPDGFCGSRAILKRKLRPSELRSCVNRGAGLGSHTLSHTFPVPNKPCGFCGRKAPKRPSATYRRRWRGPRLCEATCVLCNSLFNSCAEQCHKDNHPDNHLGKLGDSSELPPGTVDCYITLFCVQTFEDWRRERAGDSPA